jgi:hypothetical protein
MTAKGKKMITWNHIRMASAAMLVVGLSFMVNFAGAAEPIHGEGKPTSLELPQNRSFHLAFTQYSIAGLDEHMDMIALHYDKFPGVPWREALEGKPYPTRVEQVIAFQKNQLRKDQKVYLAVTPLAGRDALSWKGKDFDNPEAIAAYTNYCRRMIREFKPDYFNYGIEVNMLAWSNPAGFRKFLVMAKEVYKVLKNENANLPIFLSFQIDVYHKDQKNQEQALRHLLPYTDYMAVSCYPYMEGYPNIEGHSNPEDLPQDWFSRLAELAPSKPFAIAETGWTAKDVDVVLKNLLTGAAHVPGNEKWQARYTRFILEESHRLGGRFVVWFVGRDFATVNSETAKWWHHSGMADRDGNSRESLQIWDQWLKLPHKKPETPTQTQR